MSAEEMVVVDMTFLVSRGKVRPGPAECRALREKV